MPIPHESVLNERIASPLTDDCFSRVNGRRADEPNDACFLDPARRFKTGMDYRSLREQTRRKIQPFGGHVPGHLPLLSDEDVDLRPTDVVLDRCIALHGVIASAYDCPEPRVTAYWQREGVDEQVTDRERDFIREHSPAEAAPVAEQVEGLWALCWIVGIGEYLDPDRYCSDELAYRMPSVQPEGSSAGFRNAVQQRPVSDVVQMLDTYYCLHWYIRQASLGGRTPLRGRVDSSLVIERRRALEWALSDQDWDDVALDT